MSSVEYDLIVPTEFSKLYKLFLVILNLFRTSFLQMKLVYDAVLDLFSIFFSLDFFKTCLTCKNKIQMKKTMNEQRVKRQRKTKKIILKNKQECVRRHSFMTSAKSLNFGYSLPFPFYPQTLNFYLSRPHSWTSLIGMQNRG